MTTESAGPRTGDRDDPAAFRFSGGRPCLDFVATLGRRPTEPAERLPDPAALARWFRLAGLQVPGDGEPRLTARDLGRARELRETLYRLVRAAMADRAPERVDIAAANEAAARPDLVPRLTPDCRGVSLHRPATGGAGAALATVARDAVTLLGGPLAGRVKECQNPECSLLFLDDSQARRRRWCSMDRCGNLAKVAGYRSRARQGAPPALPAQDA